MQNVIDKIELTFAALDGFLGWFFGDLDGFLYALIIFVVMDYFTGILAAGVKKELSSAVGFKGIASTLWKLCRWSSWSSSRTVIGWCITDKDV